jgi:uncharacterized protein (TIGR01777 family)
MKILIAGATGMVGKALVETLRTRHDITVMGRSSEKLTSIFSGVNTLTWAQFKAQKDPVAPYDILINLSGENIGAGRWRQARKKAILDSRVNATEILAKACIRSANNNIRLFNASAIGVYGFGSIETVFDESTVLPVDPTGFLQTVAFAWEQALQPAETAGIRVVKMRFGVILDGQEGALAKMLPAFKLGLGGTLGSGQQAFSWVALADVVRAIEFLMDHPTVTGAVNMVAPEVVTQKVLAKKLASVLHRPGVSWMPNLVVKTLFGEMGDALLLKGVAVKSTRLAELGFEFAYPTLEKVLRGLLV